MSDRGAFVSWVVRRLRLLRIALWPPDDSRSGRSVEPLEEVLDPDGELRLRLYRRADGLYGYNVDRYQIDDNPEYDRRDEYWAPESGSGLFDSAEAARRDAALIYSWLDAAAEPGSKS